MVGDRIVVFVERFQCSRAMAPRTAAEWGVSVKGAAGAIGLPGIRVRAEIERVNIA